MKFGTSGDASAILDKHRRTLCEAIGFEHGPDHTSVLSIPKCAQGLHALSLGETSTFDYLG